MMIELRLLEGVVCGGCHNEGREGERGDRLYEYRIFGGYKGGISNKVVRTSSFSTVQESVFQSGREGHLHNECSYNFNRVERTSFIPGGN